jgi:hypothetical protein
VSLSQQWVRAMPRDLQPGAAYHGQGLRDKVQDVHAQLRKVNPTLAGQFAKRYIKP